MKTVHWNGKTSGTNPRISRVVILVLGQTWGKSLTFYGSFSLKKYRKNDRTGNSKVLLSVQF